jgi:putative selenium metabolism hydrolase
MDTVSPGDEAAWARPPFAGEIAGDVLYGRGACDMKGALAAMLYGAQAIRESGAGLKGSLYVVAVVQEEPCEGLGIRHALNHLGLRPDWAVLGEPTNLQVARGHRGRIEFDVTVRGKASHASAPERGVNAIYEAARLIVGIELLAPQLVNDAFLGRGSIAVTDMHSVAGSRNAVPDLCTLCVDRRLTVGETEMKAAAELRRIISREGLRAEIEVPTYRSVSYTGLACEARQVYPTWVMPEDGLLARRLSETIADVLGFVPHMGKWEFSTDGVYTAGEAGIPTIGFGPGEERYAHTAEEQVRLRDLEAAARVYAELAIRLLSG